GNVVVHGVDTRVLPGDAGAWRAYLNRIVRRVRLKATPQKRSNRFKQPRRKRRNTFLLKTSYGAEQNFLL
ncbi:hypothetical protein ACVGWT_00880, partial [Enterobacter hormaechei]